MNSKKWKCLLQWRMMSGEFVSAFSKVSDKLQKEIGHDLIMKASDDGEWSEIGYWV